MESESGSYLVHVRDSGKRSSVDTCLEFGGESLQCLGWCVVLSEEQQPAHMERGLAGLLSPICSPGRLIRQPLSLTSYFPSFHSDLPCSTCHTCPKHQARDGLLGHLL